MLTNEQIRDLAMERCGDEEKLVAPLARGWFEEGALFANKAAESDFATLRAENARLRAALEDVLRVANVRIDDQRIIQFDAARTALDSTKPDPVYTAAPEMLELLRNIAYPRRASDHEKWGIEHAAHEAAQLLARIEAATIPA